MRKELRVSLFLYITLGLFLSYINYKPTDGENLFLSILFGFMAALPVLFIPLIYKKFKKKDE